VAGQAGNPFPDPKGLFDMPGCKLDDCHRCKTGVHHENILAIYYGGEYVREEFYVRTAFEDSQALACTARWASSTFGGHFSGEICGRRAAEDFGDVSLCSHHAKRMRDSIADLVRAEREQAEREERERRASIERARRERQKPLVYFVERDGFVKIGYTGNLAKRIKDISKGSCLIEGMTVGPVRLLATIEGGDFDTESWMHRRFDHLRVGGEWFLPDEELREFIAGLKGCIAQDLKAIA
jgi:hypothetical protein